MEPAPTGPVTDPADPRVADYLGLPDVARRSRLERRHGFFVVEGVLAVERLLTAPGWSVRSVLVSRGQRPRLPPTTAPVLVAEPAVMNAVVGFDLHRGVVAAVDRPPPLDAGDVLAGASQALVLEGIVDHENLGGLFRTAAAFGADAVLLDPTCADPLYRRSVRVSMGHVLAVPFARLERWPDDLGLVAAAGLATIALTPDPVAEPLPAVDPDALGPAAVLVGSEGPGLSQAALAAADRRVRVPMAAGIDSLNVGVAAAVALHHLAGPSLT